MPPASDIASMTDGARRLSAGDSVLVGLIGRAIGASRTPAMHEAAGRASGLGYVYRLIDYDLMDGEEPGLGDMLRFGALLGYRGFNVTYPFKQQVVGLLDELSDDAAGVGAVNTVVLDGTRRIGHNTDLWGFRESFARGMAGAARGNVLLVGAGGAGVAVAHALLSSGVERLWIGDVVEARAGQLAARLAAIFGAGRARVAAGIPPDIDGIVNATPIGMAATPGLPVPAETITPRLWVADVVYFPLETQLLRLARQRGCVTLSGAGMAVFQAVRAFELFTGIVPDLDVMKTAFDSFDQPPRT